jgi:hypothetical protein
MPTWFWITFATLHLISFAWAMLVIKDTRKYIKNQIKVIGEEHRSRLETRKIAFMKLIYLACALAFIPLSFFAWMTLF